MFSNTSVHCSPLYGIHNEYSHPRPVYVIYSLHITGHDRDDRLAHVHGLFGPNSNRTYATEWSKLVRCTADAHTIYNGRAIGDQSIKLL